MPPQDIPLQHLQGAPERRGAFAPLRPPQALGGADEPFQELPDEPRQPQRGALLDAGPAGAPSRGLGGQGAPSLQRPQARRRKVVGVLRKPHGFRDEPVDPPQLVRGNSRDPLPPFPIGQPRGPPPNRPARPIALDADPFVPRAGRANADAGLAFSGEPGDQPAEILAAEAAPQLAEHRLLEALGGEQPARQLLNHRRARRLLQSPRRKDPIARRPDGGVRQRGGARLARVVAPEEERQGAQLEGPRGDRAEALDLHA